MATFTGGAMDTFILDPFFFVQKKNNKKNSNMSRVLTTLTLD